MRTKIYSKMAIIPAIYLASLFTSCAQRGEDPDKGKINQYAAKYVCTANIPGTSQQDRRMLPGSYQTVINVHNPTYETIKYRAKIADASGQVSMFISDTLGPDQATCIDCEQIVRDFGLDFIHGAKGFLVIESEESLDVTAVYQSGQVQGQVTSIDVEEVSERKIKPQQPPTGRCPDLVVRDIDLEKLDVDCPGGGGTCVTSITFTISNIGNAAAGAFRVKIVADPNQSVVVFHTEPAGLPAGSSKTITVTTPPGGNCFDSDCTITITVDSSNQVEECNERNNMRSATKPG